MKAQYDVADEESKSRIRAAIYVGDYDIETLSDKCSKGRSL